MLCPILNHGCVHEDCSWYDKEAERCHITFIGMIIDVMSDVADTAVKEINGAKQ